MFRSQARACYPESSPADGCFGENDTTPSRFKCWVDGSPSPADLLRLLTPQDQTEPAPRRRGGGPARRSLR
jgi:hypothetical protein